MEIFIEELKESPELLEKLTKRYPTISLNKLNNGENSIKRIPFGMFPGANLPFGSTYFSYYIADSIGLLATLKESFPDIWQKIFTTASFLLFENRAIMDCDIFVSKNITFNVGTLSSQRTSELLFQIGEKESNVFFKNWYKKIRENEYIAFDTTSIPTYSEYSNFAAFGKAKSNPDLKQVNLCLLCGEHSRLPVYQSVYNGSLNDVVTLLTVIKKFEVIAGTSDIIIINDKGFYSKKNVLDLVNKTDVKFLLAVPFNNLETKEILHEFSHNNLIEHSSSLINTNHENIYGITQERTWYHSHKFYTHIFFDPMKNLKEKMYFHEKLKAIKESYINNQITTLDKLIFDKYLIINKKVSKNSENYIIDNIEEINKHLEHEGWLILISNRFKNAQEAHDLYVNKDCIEKAFKEYKQHLQMSRFYSHNNTRITNKAFVSFVALILNSHVNRVMQDNNFFKKFTQKRMFDKINEMVAFLDIDGKYYINNITTEQKEILRAYNISIPNRYSINYFIKVILNR
jgi:transposase